MALNDTFLDFSVQAQHKSSIYVSTEDDYYVIASRLQRFKDYDPTKMENMRFMVDSVDLLHKLESELKRQPADLVVIDTFADIYPDEMNQINRVRNFLNKYSDLAQQYKSCIIFNHHTSKIAHEKPPSKNNSIGSAGFEGKVRVMIELREDYEDYSKRHFCLTKSNYLGPEYKSKSFELEFNPATGFKRTGGRKDFAQLVRPKIIAPAPSRDKEKEEVLQLHQAGKSIREITELMKSTGYKVSKTTVGEWIKALCPSGQAA